MENTGVVKQEVTKEFLAGLLKEILGPQLDEFRRDQETKGRELLTSHFAAFREASAAKATDPSKGAAFSRGLQCLAIAKGDRDRAVKIAKDRYGTAAAGTVKFLEGGEETAEGLKVKALGSNVFEDGGALVVPDTTNEVIELLRPASAVRASNPVILPLDSGTLPIPGIAGGATASYSGENAARNASQPEFRDVTLSARELGCIVPVSNKLIAAASANVDMVVRDDAIAAIGQREDLAFLFGDGSENTPRGMRYWAAAANVDATAHANTLDGVTNGITSLMQKLANGNVRMIRPGWIWTPTIEIRLRFIRDTNGHYVFREEMAAGTFCGYPFKRSTQVTASHVFHADFADCVIGQMGTMTIDASGVAAYNDSAGTVQAAFSRNQTVIRLLENHDFASRHRESIAVLTNAAWS